MDLLMNKTCRVREREESGDSRGLACVARRRIELPLMRWERLGEGYAGGGGFIKTSSVRYPVDVHSLGQRSRWKMHRQKSSVIKVVT